MYNLIYATQAMTSDKIQIVATKYDATTGPWSIILQLDLSSNNLLNNYKT